MSSDETHTRPRSTGKRRQIRCVKIEWGYVLERLINCLSHVPKASEGRGRATNGPTTASCPSSAALDFTVLRQQSTGLEPGVLWKATYSGLERNKRTLRQPEAPNSFLSLFLFGRSRFGFLLGSVFSLFFSLFFLFFSSSYANSHSWFQIFAFVCLLLFLLLLFWGEGVLFVCCCLLLSVILDFRRSSVVSGNSNVCKVYFETFL